MMCEEIDSDFKIIKRGASLIKRKLPRQNEGLHLIQTISNLYELAEMDSLIR
jgi:hypothetical protein